MAYRNPAAAALAGFSACRSLYSHAHSFLAPCDSDCSVCPLSSRWSVWCLSPSAAATAPIHSPAPRPSAYLVVVLPYWTPLVPFRFNHDGPLLVILFLRTAVAQSEGSRCRKLNSRSQGCTCFACIICFARMMLLSDRCIMTPGLHCSMLLTLISHSSYGGKPIQRVQESTSVITTSLSQETRNVIPVDTSL